MPTFVLSSIRARLGSVEAPAERFDELLRALGGIGDPRKARGVRHSFVTVLAVSVCAVLTGASSLVAIGEWAADLPVGIRERLGIGRRAPSETTIRRSLSRVDPVDLDTALTRWLAQEPPGRTDGPRVVAIDGKTCRGARTGDGQVHLLSAFDTGPGVVLGQVEVASKTNEITAFPLLVKAIDLADAVVTADAMHTQREHVAALREAGAHWILTVKDNQPKLRAMLARLPWKHVEPAWRATDAAHGRIETRTLQVVQVKAGIPLVLAHIP